MQLTQNKSCIKIKNFSSGRGTLIYGHYRITDRIRCCCTYRQKNTVPQMISTLAGNKNKINLSISPLYRIIPLYHKSLSILMSKYHWLKKYNYLKLNLLTYRFTALSIPIWRPNMDLIVYLHKTKNLSSIHLCHQRSEPLIQDKSFFIPLKTFIHYFKYYIRVKLSCENHKYKKTQHFFNWNCINT